MIKPPHAGQHFTRAHYPDIARCFTIRNRMLPLSGQLVVGDGVCGTRLHATSIWNSGNIHSFKYQAKGKK